MMYKEERDENDEFIIVHVISVPCTKWDKTIEEIYKSDRFICYEFHPYDDLLALNYIHRKLREQIPSDDYMITSDGFTILKKHDDNTLLENLMKRRHFIDTCSSLLL